MTECMEFPTAAFMLGFIAGVIGSAIALVVLRGYDDTKPS